MKRRRSRTPLFNINLTAKPLVSIIFIIGMAVGYGVNNSLSPSSFPVDSQEMRICFTPGGSCASKIISIIRESKSEILVQAYAFTSPHIAEALIDARKRGIDVKILFDRKSAQSSHSQISKLKKAGITAIPERTKGIAHNKIMIIDKKLVITGSYNWTNGAEHRNSENILMISNPQLAEEYAKNWMMLARLHP